MRRQVWYTLVLLILTGASVVVSANTDTPSNSPLSLANIFAIASSIIALVFTAGSIREQFADLRERVDRLEREIPQTYVRKDVYHAYRTDD